MKKGLKIGLIIAAVVVVIGIAWAGTYNKMVSARESVTAQWSQVENVYQRRMDLIPNLVATVKGYAKHESDVFTNIAEARSKAGGVTNIDKSVIDDPEAFAKYQQVQNELGASLQRLLVVSENYPELKADQNFLSLQDQLEGTENRIAQERRRYNDTAQSYNAMIQKFPAVIVANISGFKTKAYFTADEKAAAAPVVSF